MGGRRPLPTRCSTNTAIQCQRGEDPRGSATPTLSVGPERPRPTPLVEQQTLKLTRILDAHSTMSPPHVAATIIETPWIGCNRLLQ